MALYSPLVALGLQVTPIWTTTSTSSPFASTVERPGTAANCFSGWSSKRSPSSRYLTEGWCNRALVPDGADTTHRGHLSEADNQHRQYGTDEQRSQTRGPQRGSRVGVEKGCIAGRMQTNFRDTTLTRGHSTRTRSRAAHCHDGNAADDGARRRARADDLVGSDHRRQLPEQQGGALRGGGRSRAVPRRSADDAGMGPGAEWLAAVGVRRRGARRLAH